MMASRSFEGRPEPEAARCKGRRCKIDARTGSELSLKREDFKRKIEIIKRRRRRRRHRRGATNFLHEITATTGRQEFKRSARTEASGFLGHIFCLLTILLASSLPPSAAYEDDNLPAFHEQPQALFLSAFNLESGSGQGYANSLPSQPDGSASSSSVSPSLIMAKCWNNYENDNDCKELNFITGGGGGADSKRPQEAGGSEEDDSLITPVIVFESSTPLEEEPPEVGPQFVAPPFFSSTPLSQATNRTPWQSRPRQPEGSSGNQTPAPPNEDVYSAPPANATVRLPATSNARPYAFGGASSSSSSSPRPEVAAPAVTGHPKGVFVATPAPRKPPKTSTAGRKCRDENDGDCDEPEEENNNIRGESDNDEDDDEDEGDRSSTGSSSNWRPESGSGESPMDDNEDSGDDGDDDPRLEGSGGSETGGFMVGKQTSTTSSSSSLTTITTTMASGRFVQITSTTSGRPEAEIDVVVHSTLPASFTRVTSTARSLETEEPPLVVSTPATPTTTPSDDLFKSKPVFPPEAPGGEPGGDREAASEFPLGALLTTTSASTETIDLATFKPIPMRTERPAGELNAGREGPSGISDRYTLVPNEAPATSRTPTIESPWQEKPPTTRRPFPMPTTSHPDKPEFRPRPDNLPQNGELLYRLLIYAGTIIVSSAIIMSVIVFMILRQRRRLMALKQPLQGQHQLLLGPNQVGGPNGGSFPNQARQMVASMQQGNQLAGKVHQPSLLDTYAPGKPLSVIKRHEQEADEDDEDDDELGELGADELEQLENGSLLGGRAKAAKEAKLSGATGRQKQQQQMQGPASWSTEEQTSSSGSQKTNDSGAQIGIPEPEGRGMQNLQNGRQQQQQYANSLSDGRQNSSSLSDSNSPEAMAPNPQYPPPAPPQQQQQQPGYHPNQPQLGPRQQVAGFAGNAGMFGQQPFQQPAQRPPHFNPDYAMMRPAFAPAMPNNRFAPPPLHPEAYLERKPLHLGNGFMGGESLAGSGLSAHPRQPFPMGPIGNLEQQFQRPINPARIALNPLATMSRRPQAANLNRTIYSEDSSSFITASPSLARTSSSSSFAFTNQNGSQLNTPIRAKPFIDPATGRLFNDYTSNQAAGAGPPNANGAPPALKRKSDFGEPWYV